VCAAGADCSLTGLTNGTPYRLSARAVNQHGAGEWSDFSDQVTPYGTPGTPQPVLQSAGKWAAASATWTWPEVNAAGGSTTYAWSASTGASGTGRSATLTGLGAGAHSITVVATNTGGKSSAAGTGQAANVRDQPPPADTGVPAGTASGERAGASIVWTWAATVGEASEGITYYWSLNGGGLRESATASASVAGVAAGTYSISVYAQNKGGKTSAQVSAPITIKPTLPATHVVACVARAEFGAGDSVGLAHYEMPIGRYNFYVNGVFDKVQNIDRLTGTQKLVTGLSDQSVTVSMQLVGGGPMYTSEPVVISQSGYCT